MAWPRKRRIPADVVDDLADGSLAEPDPESGQREPKLHPILERPDYERGRYKSDSRCGRERRVALDRRNAGVSPAREAATDARASSSLTLHRPRQRLPRAHRRAASPETRGRPFEEPVACATVAESLQKRSTPSRRCFNGSARRRVARTDCGGDGRLSLSWMLNIHGSSQVGAARWRGRWLGRSSFRGDLRPVQKRGTSL